MTQGTPVFIDTSALYAALDASDDFHTQARAGWAYIRERELHPTTTNYILLEAVALAQTRISFDAVRTLHRAFVPLLSVHTIDAQEHDDATQSLLTASRRRLSLVDCSSFVVMRKLGIRRAFTYDKHFREQGFELLST